MQQLQRSDISAEVTLDTTVRAWERKRGEDWRAAVRVPLVLPCCIMEAFLLCQLGEFVSVRAGRRLVRVSP